MKRQTNEKMMRQLKCTCMYTNAFRSAKSPMKCWELIRVRLNYFIDVRNQRQRRLYSTTFYDLSMCCMNNIDNPNDIKILTNIVATFKWKINYKLNCSLFMVMFSKYWLHIKRNVPLLNKLTAYYAICYNNITSANKKAIQKL